MATTLYYNGITLDTIKTTQFSQEAEYDQSHTDYLYTKLTIGVRAVINRGNLPGTALETPPQTLVRIRKCLMAQNGLLVYTAHGVDLVYSPEPGKSEDAKHGPFPIRCNIVQLTEATFLIDYAVETYIIECCSGSPILPYISNRWDESHSIDEHFYTRRTVRGRVIFRADYINSKKFSNGTDRTADFYRGLIAPPALPLQPNFRRLSMDFLTSADGLALDYTIVDQEEYVMPPDDCTKFEAEHTVTCSKGAVYSDMITVTVYGDAKTPKTTLITRAAEIILDRLDLADRNNRFIRSGAVKDRIHENVVEIRIETFASARKQTYLGLNPGDINNPNKLDYLSGDRRSFKQPDPGMRGIANLPMLVYDSYLSLCTQEQVQQLIGIPFDQPTADGFITELRSGVVDELPRTETKFRQAELVGGVYTEYVCEIEYIEDRQTLQMPYMDTAETCCAVIPVAQPLVTKEVTWKAERWGLPPKVPAAATSNANNVLLSAKTKPMNVDVAPDGVTSIYTVAGTYVFAVKCPGDEAMLAGRPPYMDAELTATFPAIFTTGLIDQEGTAELSTGGPAIWTGSSEGGGGELTTGGPPFPPP